MSCGEPFPVQEVDYQYLRDVIKQEVEFQLNLAKRSSEPEARDIDTYEVQPCCGKFDTCENMCKPLSNHWKEQAESWKKASEKWQQNYNELNELYHKELSRKSSAQLNSLDAERYQALRFVLMRMGMMGLAEIKFVKETKNDEGFGTVVHRGIDNFDAGVDAWIEKSQWDSNGIWRIKNE